MAENSKGRAAFKFVFWTGIVVALFYYVLATYTSGRMVRWYYHSAAADGYAVNANNFMDATKDNPAVLTIGTADAIQGLQAVRVKKGDRLPEHTNGLITDEELGKKKRAFLEGETIKVTVPWEIKEKKGFKFKDTFKHKGVKTYPWAGVWNVVMVLTLGLSLGMMAEGLTDLLGIKLEKIDHHQMH
jgi:hypothetical protein